MFLVSQVAKPVSPVRPETLGSVVYDRFSAEPDTLVVAVVDDTGRPVGLVERNTFAIRMAREYGRALYAGRPISLIMDAEPLVVEAETSVISFTGGALSTRPADLLKGFIVVQDGIYLGVGHSLALLQAANEENRSQAEAMTLLAEDLSAAEVESQAATQRLREAVDAMPEGMAYFDADHRFLLWNRRYAELHPQSAPALHEGAQFAEVLGYGLKHGQYPDAEGRETAWLAERLARQSGPKAAHEQRLPEDRWVRIEEKDLPSGGRISVAVDITDLKRRESSFRLLFDNNPIAMVVWDRETGRLLALNPEALDQYGLTADDAGAATVFEILAAEEHARFRELAARSEPLPYQGIGTWRHRRKDGVELEVQPFVRPMMYEGRISMLAALFDVTEKKRQAEALSQARDAAEASNRAKSEFLANMSHEIRTPLNGVVGVADVLARTGLDPAQQEMIGIVQSSAKALERLLSDILDLARVESGRLRISHEPFELAASAREAAALFAPSARAKGLEFDLDLAPELEGWVEGDAVRLKQILFNLLSNAVKFTAQGRVSLQGRARTVDQALWCVFEVRDTGIGFDPTLADTVFGRFQQADGSITRRYGGSGLGLAISKDLAELMGGALEVESCPGQGASFRLTLPLSPVVAAEDGAPAREGAQPLARTTRVLVADDHPTNRRVVELMLSAVEVELVSVENGAEAVEAFKAAPFDCVLMDLQMPVMDGLSAIRAIRALEAEQASARIPILALSANALPEHIEASRAAGADGHLTKPITAEALLGALSAALTQTETGELQSSAA